MVQPINVLGLQNAYAQLGQVERQRAMAELQARQARRQAGGRLLGAAIGSFGGPAGAAIGAGIGGLGAELYSNGASPSAVNQATNLGIQGMGMYQQQQAQEAKQAEIDQKKAVTAQINDAQRQQRMDALGFASSQLETTPSTVGPTIQNRNEAQAYEAFKKPYHEELATPLGYAPQRSPQTQDKTLQKTPLEELGVTQAGRTQAFTDLPKARHVMKLNETLADPDVLANTDPETYGKLMDVIAPSKTGFEIKNIPNPNGQGSTQIITDGKGGWKFLPKSEENYQSPSKDFAYSRLLGQFAPILQGQAGGVASSGDMGPTPMSNVDPNMMKEELTQLGVMKADKNITWPQYIKAQNEFIDRYSQEVPNQSRAEFVLDQVEGVDSLTPAQRNQLISSYGVGGDPKKANAELRSATSRTVLRNKRSQFVNSLEKGEITDRKAIDAFINEARLHGDAGKPYVEYYENHLQSMEGKKERNARLNVDNFLDKGKLSEAHTHISKKYAEGDIDEETYLSLKQKVDSYEGNLKILQSPTESKEFWQNAQNKIFSDLGVTATPTTPKRNYKNMEKFLEDAKKEANNLAFLKLYQDRPRQKKGDSDELFVRRLEDFNDKLALVDTPKAKQLIQNNNARIQAVKEKKLEKDTTLFGKFERAFRKANNIPKDVELTQEQIAAIGGYIGEYKAREQKPITEAREDAQLHADLKRLNANIPLRTAMQTEQGKIDARFESLDKILEIDGQKAYEKAFFTRTAQIDAQLAGATNIMQAQRIIDQAGIMKEVQIMELQREDDLKRTLNMPIGADSARQLSKDLGVKIDPTWTLLELKENVGPIEVSGDKRTAEMKNMSEKAKAGLGFLDELEDVYYNHGGTRYVGRGKGTMTLVAKGIGMTNETQSQLLSKTSALHSMVVNAISGAAVSHQEAERILGFVPQVTDGPELFKQKINDLRTYLTRMRDAGLNDRTLTQQMNLEKAGKGGLKGIRDMSFQELDSMSEEDVMNLTPEDFDLYYERLSKEGR